MRNPDREFWAKLHVPALQIRALGYYYLDPVGSHSFGAVCDLPAASRETLAAAARDGFRPTKIHRLNGFETMRSHASTSAEMEQYNAADFERGGHHGVVVWELSERERDALGLPVEPPWAATYRGEAPAVGPSPAEPAVGLAALRGAASPAALLPQPLRGYFVVRQETRQYKALALGALLVAVGAWWIWDSLQPSYPSMVPLVPIGIGLILAAPLPFLWTRLVPDAGLWLLLREDIVWIYGANTRVMRGGTVVVHKHEVRIASDHGIDATIESGFTPADQERFLRAILELHPGAHVGHTPELIQAWNTRPASLRRSGSPTPATWRHLAYRLRGVLPWAIVGFAMLAQVVLVQLILASWFV